MKTFFRIGLFSGCIYFLYSIWTMWYLAFDGNGMRGLMIGIANVTIVNLLFLLVFTLSLYALFPLQYILVTGTFLSCNGCYWAVVRQAAFDSGTLPLQSYLYLLPFFYLFLFLFIKNAGHLKGNVCKVFLKYRYFSFGTILLFLSVFLPKHAWSTPIFYFNYVLIFLLAFLQWKRDFSETFLMRKSILLTRSGTFFINFGERLMKVDKL